jgi:hypothetical protein
LFVLIVALVGAALLATAYVAGERLGMSGARRLRNVGLILLAPSAAIGVWVFWSSARACAELGDLQKEIDRFRKEANRYQGASTRIRAHAGERNWEAGPEYSSWSKSPGWLQCGTEAETKEYEAHQCKAQADRLRAECTRLERRQQRFVTVLADRARSRWVAALVPSGASRYELRHTD